jgi:hypothetical protein
MRAHQRRTGPKRPRRRFGRAINLLAALVVYPTFDS